MLTASGTPAKRSATWGLTPFSSYGIPGGASRCFREADHVGMLRPMTDERGAASTLKGRLADVYLPALVEGALSALSRRLGNRATIDDPLFGRASTLSSIDPLLEKFSTHFKNATCRHVASAT